MTYGHSSRSDYGWSVKSVFYIINLHFTATIIKKNIHSRQSVKCCYIANLSGRERDQAHTSHTPLILGTDTHNEWQGMH